ncbi:MAG: restriction endonuclease subunit S [Chitinophagales bacterium]|nr:restriction endonuclease subunit S [Chitinophagales bacterium]
MTDSQLKNIDIPLHLLPEQQKIASFLSALDQKINSMQEGITKTELWKKGLLQQLFSQ